jgi:hypothetical protein
MLLAPARSVRTRLCPYEVRGLACVWVGLLTMLAGFLDTFECCTPPSCLSSSNAHSPFFFPCRKFTLICPRVAVRYLSLCIFCSSMLLGKMQVSRRQLCTVYHSDSICHALYALFCPVLHCPAISASSRFLLLELTSVEDPSS